MELNFSKTQIYFLSILITISIIVNFGILIGVAIKQQFIAGVVYWSVIFGAIGMLWAGVLRFLYLRHKAASSD